MKTIYFVCKQDENIDFFHFVVILKFALKWVIPSCKISHNCISNKNKWNISVKFNFIPIGSYVQRISAFLQFSRINFMNLTHLLYPKLLSNTLPKPCPWLSASLTRQKKTRMSILLWYFFLMDSRGTQTNLASNLAEVLSWFTSFSKNFLPQKCFLKPCWENLRQVDGKPMENFEKTRNLG